MPLKNIEQPKEVILSKEIRLIAYDGNHEVPLKWYKDKFVYYNSEGITEENKIPDEEYINRMYSFLDKNSELYFIEIYNGDEYLRIGDVAIKPVNPPIVIGNANYRGKGYSKLVMNYVIQRLKMLGYCKIENSTVYKYNEISKKMHLSLGFKIVNETEKEFLMSRDLI